MKSCQTLQKYKESKILPTILCHQFKKPKINLQFLKYYNIPRLNLEEKENVNGPMTRKKIETAIKTLSKIKRNKALLKFI